MGPLEELLRPDVAPMHGIHVSLRTWHVLLRLIHYRLLVLLDILLGTKVGHDRGWLVSSLDWSCSLASSSKETCTLDGHS